MPTTAEVIVELRLVPLTGPMIDPIGLTGGSDVTVGRSASCEVVLPDPMVSRWHAAFMYRGGTWFVTDLGSRHSTQVNGAPVKPHTPTGLDDGDLLNIGPWTFRVALGDSGSRAMATTNDLVVTSGRIERIAPGELSALAQQRLQLLIECAAQINTAGDEHALAASVIESVLAGSGYSRAAVVRPLRAGEEVEILAFRDKTGSKGPPSLSRSLIQEAAAGNLVRLASELPPNYGESIISLSIHSAISAPIFLGTTVAACLYMDARGDETAVKADAADFCQAVARVAGLALSNLKRVELERRHARLERDLTAAREAQQFIVPSSSGTLGPTRYAMRMKPGRIVAGDLFDLMQLEDGRVGVCIGDVTGEGVGAAILMATTQAHLHAAIMRSADPAAALNIVNPYIARRSALDRFVSMWVGVFDREHRRLRYVDGGHGHWLHVRPGQDPVMHRPRHLVVGVDPDHRYDADELSLEDNDRIVLFSDGIKEQPSPEGEQFGVERVIEIVRSSASAEEDVRRIFEAVERFAGTPRLADDSTVASIEWVPLPSGKQSGGPEGPPPV